MSVTSTTSLKVTLIIESSISFLNFSIKLCAGAETHFEILVVSDKFEKASHLQVTGIV